MRLAAAVAYSAPVARSGDERQRDGVGRSRHRNDGTGRSRRGSRRPSAPRWRDRASPTPCSRPATRSSPSSRRWSGTRRTFPGATWSSSTWTSTWGSARTTRPASGVGSASASSHLPVPGPPTTSTASPTPEEECRPLRRTAHRASPRPLLPGHRRERPSGVQRPAGGRLRRPTRRQGGGARRRPAVSSRSTKATSPPSPTSPTRAMTVTIPALLRAGRVLADRARGPKGRAGPRRTRRTGDHRLPRLDPPAHAAMPRSSSTRASAPLAERREGIRLP